MSKREQKTPDWALMIEQLIAKGLTLDAIGAAMDSVLTERMVRHYRLGAQPLHWRGEGLINLWCEKLKKKRDKVPMAEKVEA